MFFIKYWPKIRPHWKSDFGSFFLPHSGYYSPSSLPWMPNKKKKKTPQNPNSTPTLIAFGGYLEWHEICVANDRTNSRIEQSANWWPLAIPPAFISHGNSPSPIHTQIYCLTLILLEFHGNQKLIHRGFGLFRRATGVPDPLPQQHIKTWGIEALRPRASEAKAILFSPVILPGSKSPLLRAPNHPPIVAIPGNRHCLPFGVSILSEIRIEFPTWLGFKNFMIQGLATPYQYICLVIISTVPLFLFKPCNGLILYAFWIQNNRTIKLR